MIAKFPRFIADALGLPNPEYYTGHCMRRAAISHASDKGLTLTQIKGISGHKSESVVQSYISKSHAQRALAANALSLDEPNPLLQSAPAVLWQEESESSLRYTTTTSLVYNNKRQKLEDLL